MCFYNGRCGRLDSLFVADEKEIEEIISKSVYFGEKLGKHSEVYGELEPDMFTVKSEDQELIEKLIAIFGTTISGYNPLEYLREEEE